MKTNVDNGTVITLGLVGALAALGSFASRRGSFSKGGNMLHWGARVEEPHAADADSWSVRVPLTLPNGKSDEVVDALRSVVTKKSGPHGDYALESVTKGRVEGAPAGAEWTARVRAWAPFNDEPDEDGPRLGERRGWSY